MTKHKKSTSIHAIESKDDYRLQMIWITYNGAILSQWFNSSEDLRKDLQDFLQDDKNYQNACIDREFNCDPLDLDVCITFDLNIFKTMCQLRELIVLDHECGIRIY